MYQTTTHQNLDDVTLSKQVTAEQESVCIVLNSVSLIESKRRNVKKSCDFKDEKCYRPDC